MIDFSELKLIKDPNDNFVGIRKSLYGDKYEFCLPNGFDNFPENDFDKIKDLFFTMYRTFRKFETDNKSNRINRNRPDYQTDQDQTTVSSGGISLQTENGETCQLYSKLKMIERVLEAYDDLAINSIQKKIKRTEDIDYSQIHKYLDRAIYLDNDVIYVESMDLPKPMLRYESSDIIYLYCYILDEIIQQLQEDVSDNIKYKIQDIRFLGQRFQDDYLTSGQSIFDKDTFLETTSILKEALDNIDKNTYYKDADYWGIYEAIETFLYGELNPNLDDGEYWGIKGFSLIWEDMCQVYFFRNHQSEICYADTDILLKNYSNNNFLRDESESNRVGNIPLSVSDGTYIWRQWIYSTEINRNDDDDKRSMLKWHELIVIEFDLNERYLVLTTDRGDINFHPSYEDLVYEYDYPASRNLQKTKFLRPDLVLKNENNHLRIIDYKDVPLKFYLDASKLTPMEYNKYKFDTIKQLTYELALQSYKIEKNQFFIPYYYESPPLNNKLGDIEPNLDLRGITVFKANFFLIQQEYLQENL
jgi:hypothetical protein